MGTRVAAVDLGELRRLQARVHAVDPVVVEEREPPLAARALVLEERDLVGLGAVEVLEPLGVEVVVRLPEDRVVEQDRPELELAQPRREADVDVGLPDPGGEWRRNARRCSVTVDASFIQGAIGR